MVRRYEEPIEVRQRCRSHASGAGQGDQPVNQTADLTGDLTSDQPAGEPDAFVWRGRLYVVRAVLDHWQERRPWWRDAREREGSDVLTDARERQVWRVEASAGRLAGVGVYDLCAVHHENHEPPGHGQWRLLRVAD